MCAILTFCAVLLLKIQGYKEGCGGRVRGVVRRDAKKRDCDPSDVIAKATPLRDSLSSKSTFPPPQNLTETEIVLCMRC